MTRTLLCCAAAALLLVIVCGYQSMRRGQERLRAANGALERALRARTAALATTSHELRTPLNGILGMAQVILADPTLSGGSASAWRLSWTLGRA